MATRHGRTRNRSRLRCEPLEARDTPAAVTVIDYAAGFAAGPRLRGQPATEPADHLLLTDGPYQARAVWAADPVHVGAFRTSFVFRLEGEPGRLGDGFTFALVKAHDDLGRPGTAGAGLGYQRLADSVSVKFDLVNNAGEGGHSVGVFTGGAEPTLPAVRLDGSPIHLHAQPPILADLAYDGELLTVSLTDITLPDHTWTHQFPVDIPAAVGGPTAHVGFTAGTGELSARQAIDSWTFAEVLPDAPTGTPPEITSLVGHTSSGSFVTLRSLVADDGGPAAVTYSWSVVSTPVGGTADDYPGTSDPWNAYVQMTRGGLYVFRLTVRDEDGQTATREVEVYNSSVYASLEVFPQTATVPAGGTVQFTAVIRDNYGYVLPGARPDWHVMQGPGTITPDGLYTAPTGVSGRVSVGATIYTGDPRYARRQDAYASVWINSVGPARDVLDYDQSGGMAVPYYGSARLTADHRLRLTDGPHQAGSAFFGNPIDVRGFATAFWFRVGESPAGSAGDGLAFVLQNAGRAALGAAGGGLGYEGIPDSVAFKIDLVDNAGEGPDSFGVYTGGAAPTTPADRIAGFRLHAGHVYRARLDYAGGVLRVELKDWDYNGGGTFSRTYAVDIPAAVGGERAYVGFTAGTGERFAPIDVWDWVYIGTDNWDPGSIPIPR